jgi:ABC-type antimicrobial peptide transport system permease subunit
VRTRTGGEGAFGRDLRRLVGELDPELPVFNVRTLTDHVETNLIFRRIPARMFAVLGPMLLVLSSIGIYAVVAYTVSLRTTEVGVRVALGASVPRLLTHLMGESLRVILVGALIGWLIAFAAASDLMDAGAIDLPVFIGVPALLLAVATMACWLPARRATRIDPSAALRQE